MFRTRNELESHTAKVHGTGRRVVPISLEKAEEEPVNIVDNEGIDFSDSAS